MTHDRDIERLLDRWLADGPTQASDRVFDDAVARIGRQRQRPAWLLREELPVTSMARLAVAAAAAVVVAVVGFNFVRPSGPGSSGITPSVSSSPSSSPSVEPSASLWPIVCEDDLPGCAGPLAVGSHRSSQFQPVLFYDTPAEVTGLWRNVVDRETVFKLDPPDPFYSYALLWSNATITDRADPCSSDPDPTLGRKAADWVAALRSQPGLVASEPVPVDFDNAIGTQFELGVSSAWTTTCPGEDMPLVRFLNQSVNGRPNWYGLPSDQRVLVTVVDVADRTVVILSYGSSNASQFTSQVRPTRDLIATFRFGCGVRAGRPCLNSYP